MYLAILLNYATCICKTQKVNKKVYVCDPWEMCCLFTLSNRLHQDVGFLHVKTNDIAAKIDRNLENTVKML